MCYNTSDIQQWKSDRDLWHVFLTCVCCTCVHVNYFQLYVNFDLTLPYINGWSNDIGNGNCNAVCSLGGNGNAVKE